jgi:hypothetical protein
MTREDRALCATTAHFIGSYRMVAGLGLVCTGLCMVLMHRPWLPAAAAPSCDFGKLLLGTGLMLGLCERYYAVRLRFDSGLFEELAHNDQFDLRDVDMTLERLGLRRTDALSRDLTSRVAGTVRLCKRHRVGVGLQVVVLLTAALV